MAGLKIYCGSLLALTDVSPGVPDSKTHVEHRPFLRAAKSIEDATELAQQDALKYWPLADGWYGHAANILCVTREIYNVVFEGQAAGLLDLNGDDGHGVFQLVTEPTDWPSEVW